MSNLFSFFGLNEMARSAGSFGKIMRAALEKARAHGAEFTVKQFCAWMIEAGAENAQPTSVKTRLNKLIAGEGQRPSAFQPLVTTNKGRTGPGDPARLKYAFDGPAGAAAKSDLNKPKDDDEDEIPFEDDDDIAANAPKNAGWPKWLPKPDADGDYDQQKMAQLQDAGYGADQNQLWADIAQAENNIAVHDLVKKAGVPPQLRMAVVRVAQEVFKNLNKPWDAVTKPLSKARNWVDDDDSGGAFSEPEDGDETELGDDDFEDEEDTDPGIPEMEPDEEEPEATQAGAANFLKPAAPAPAAPAAPPKPAATQPPPAPAKKSSVSKFFRR